MNLNQLRMINLAPRGVRGTCVPTSLCFVTGECYQDVDHLLTASQARYRAGQGVFSIDLLGDEKQIFGYKFTRVKSVVPRSRRLYSIRELYSTGTYVVTINHHMLVLKDGEFFDLCETNPNSIVIAMWRVEKA